MREVEQSREWKRISDFIGNCDFEPCVPCGPDYIEEEEQKILLKWIHV